MSAPPNAAADAPPRPAVQNCGAIFSRAVASKWPLGLAARPRVSGSPDRSLDVTLTMSAGVADATAVTPEIKPLTAGSQQHRRRPRCSCSAVPR